MKSSTLLSIGGCILMLLGQAIQCLSEEKYIDEAIEEKFAEMNKEEN